MDELVELVEEGSYLVVIVISGHVVDVETEIGVEARDALEGRCGDVGAALTGCREPADGEVGVCAVLLRRRENRLARGLDQVEEPEQVTLEIGRVDMTLGGDEPDSGRSWEIRGARGSAFVACGRGLDPRPSGDLIRNQPITRETEDHMRLVAVGILV